jgi:hypothetical protein
LLLLRIGICRIINLMLEDLFVVRKCPEGLKWLDCVNSG